MKAWEHDINDVLIVNYKGVEQPARVVDFVDSLDDTKPLYVNLRVTGGASWGARRTKIQPSQIIRADPDWYERQHAAWEQSIKETVDATYAKMTPAQRKRVLEQAEQRRQRSPIEIMIDRACGLE